MKTYDLAHRKGKAVVRPAGPDGAALKNAGVTVSQTKQDALFGCAGFESVPLLSGRLSGDAKTNAEKRVEKMLGLFNFITLPFYWGRFEPERGKPDTAAVKKAAEWWQSRDVRTKGHPLCWHTVTADWLLTLSDEEILETQLSRIRRDVSDFAGVTDMWDVINEVVIMPVFDKYDNGITRICKREGRVGLVKQVFAAARETNPKATLLINDFDMSQAYADLLDELLNAGVPIDAIGLQSHMHQGYWGLEKTDEVLARFARFGLPLHFTEINLVSGEIMPARIGDLNDYVVDSWPTTPEGEQRQAEQVAELYARLFAEPLVQAVTYWSFSDGGWLNAPAGLTTDDAREKPAYTALRRLIKEEWTTPVQNLTTDENGMLTVCGFKGDYTAEFEGGSLAFSIG